MLGRIFKRIPFFEALRAFLEQWGIWKFIAGAGTFAVALVMSAWAWLESHLPYWAIASTFIIVFVTVLGGLNFAYGLLLKRRQVKLMESVTRIDRDGLANDLEEMSRNIAALVGEFLGPMQEAWWSSTDHSNPLDMHTSRAQIEGKLLEKYSYRHGADVWRLIRRASKVVPLDRSDLWRIQHGVRGEHDLVSVYMFLASLADDIRTPRAPLPQTDKVREQMVAKAESPVPQLPQDTPA